MTDEEARTALLLGMKVKRNKWGGYLHMNEGAICKYDSINNVSYPLGTTTDSILNNKSAENKYGPWEKVNES